MRTHPPETVDVARALASAPFACPLAAAAAFLASPVATLPGGGAGADLTRVWVGDHETRLRSMTVADVAEAAATTAAAAHQPEDRYLDLTADPSTWFKVARSGWRRVVFGPDLLWGTPKLTLEDTVDGTVVAEVVAAWRAAGPLLLPTMLPTAGGPVLLDGTSRRVVIRDLTSGPAPAAAVASATATDAAVDIAARLGGTLVRVGVDDDGWVASVLVPALGRVQVAYVTHAGAYQLRHPARRATGTDGPGGFEVLEVGVWVHAATGVVVTADDGPTVD